MGRPPVVPAKKKTGVGDLDHPLEGRIRRGREDLEVVGIWRGWVTAMPVARHPGRVLPALACAAAGGRCGVHLLPCQSRCWSVEDRSPRRRGGVSGAVVGCADPPPDRDRPTGGVGRRLPGQRPGRDHCGVDQERVDPLHKARVTPRLETLHYAGRHALPNGGCSKQRKSPDPSAQVNVKG